MIVTCCNYLTQNSRIGHVQLQYWAGSKSLPCFCLFAKHFVQRGGLEAFTDALERDTLHDGVKEALH